MQDYLDLFFEQDPRLLSMFLAATVVPTLHDLLVKWDAPDRTKTTVSTVLAIGVALLTVFFVDPEANFVETVQAAAFAIGGAEISFRKQHKLVGESPKYVDGVPKPTPLAVAPNFGIGASTSLDGEVPARQDRVTEGE